MFLIPIVTTPKATPSLKQYWMFLERNGNHLIDIDVSGEEGAIAAATTFLAENELTPVAPPFVVGSLVFAPVQPLPDLVNFYTWSETPPGTTPPREVWRPFLWVTSATDLDPWGVNKLLEEITLAEPSITAFSVLSTFLHAPQAEHVK